ncbi:MAG TPA: type VI secretion system membrane subunit TssM [Pyrinomonadaceae bacterium]|nr:type VI secretion system membrane subunit TssM [Pyrinomonadaceae bacterium]
MSVQGDQIKSALGISALVSFYGIASLAVYFLGPSLGIGLAWQVAIIGLILLTWPLGILISRLSARRARKREAMAAEGAPPEEGKAAAPPKRVYDELSRAAEEAVQWLRSSLLAGANSKRAVYALPWFVVAGPPASGKTSLLLASGLDFHALPSQQGADYKMVRATRHCDWRVSDSGVFIDTAGRYQGDGPARDEWMALLETIRKYRADRPLDGFLITINTRFLLVSQEADIEQLAKTLRARLDELIQVAKSRFPVYVLFSHLDAINGFRDFFGGAGASAGSEVFGVTIPLDKSPGAHALFDVEFDHLYQSLTHRRLLLLQAPASAKARLNIFDFPWRFRDAQAKLGLFTSMMFRPNPFSESPLLRGFYFTANVGNDDRARLRVVADAEAESPVAAVGTGYFTDRFFREVLLRDRDLAASFQALRKRPSRLKFYLLAAGVLLLFAFAAGATMSFVGNAQLLSQATEHGVRVEAIRRADLGKDVTKKEPVAAREEVEAVEALRETLAALNDYEHNSPPLRLRFGLYSGNAIQSSLRAIYFDSITQRYVKPAGAALEQDLRTFAAGGSVGPSPSSTGSEADEAEVLGRNYDLLKAYKMLSDRSRVDPTFLADQLASYWKKTSPAEKDSVSLQQLQFFASQAGEEDAPQYPIDNALVQNVQRKLAAYPAYKRYFKQVISEVNAQTQSITIDTIIKGSGSDEIVGTYSVPGSFTVDGYRNHMKAVFESKSEDISKDDWVLGSAATSAGAGSNNMEELKRLYWNQYSDHWSKFLKGIRVRPFDNAPAAAASLRELSSNSSPLTEILIVVARNTQVSIKPQESGVWQWIKSFFQSETPKDKGGETPVEREFQPLFEFVGSGEPKGASASTQYRDELLQIGTRLENQSQEKLAETAKAMLAGKDDLGLQKAERTAERLSKTPAATNAAALLKQPIENVRALLYQGVSVQIEQEWVGQLYPKARQLEGGYPFGAGPDTSVADLAQFLNPVNGKFSLFINKLLVTSIDGTPGQWQRKSASSIPISDEFLKYLNDTARLRDALFQNSTSPLPEVSYQFTLEPVKEADVTVDMYSTSLHAQDNSEQSPKLIWPATGGSLEAKITVTPRATSQPEQPAAWPGEWALFRWFDDGYKGQSSTGPYKLSWLVASVPVQATLNPMTANHPFDRRLFRNWHAPKEIH